MSSVKVEIVAAYRAVLDAEQNALGFISDPSVVPLQYDSFLSSITLEECRTTLFDKLSEMPSFAESAILDTVSKITSIKREAAIRRMGRGDYYSTSIVDGSDEIMRLERSKIGTIQGIFGTVGIQAPR